jgi:hypothetical protein
MKTIILTLVIAFTCIGLARANQATPFVGITVVSEGEFHRHHDLHGEVITQRMLKNSLRGYDVVARWTHSSKRVIGHWVNLRYGFSGGEAVIMGDFVPTKSFTKTKQYKRLLDAYYNKPNSLAVSIVGYFDFCRQTLYYKAADFVREGAATSGLFNEDTKPERFHLPKHLRGNYDDNPNNLIGPRGALEKIGPRF